MKTYKCIEKCKDKSGKICSYILISTDNKEIRVPSDKLKLAIQR